MHLTETVEREGVGRYLRGVLEPPESPYSHKHEHCCRAGHGPDPQMWHCQRQHRSFRPQHYTMQRCCQLDAQKHLADRPTTVRTGAAGHSSDPQMWHCKRQYRRFRSQHCIFTFIESQVSVKTTNGRLRGTEERALALILRCGTANATTEASGRSTASTYALTIKRIKV